MRVNDFSIFYMTPTYSSFLSFPSYSVAFVDRWIAMVALAKFSRIIRHKKEHYSPWLRYIDTTNYDAINFKTFFQIFLNIFLK